MRRIFTLAFILAAAPALAQGAISLTTPITFSAPPSIATYQPGSLQIDLVPTPRIVVVIVSGPTQTLSFEYPKDCQPVPPSTTPVCANLDTSGEVDALITTLNTVNLATRSLWRRVFDRLVADFPTRFPGGGTVQ